MTPEERADVMFKRRAEGCDCGMCALGLVQDVAAAIRKAQREAYEDAASLANLCEDDTAVDMIRARMKSVLGE